MCLPVHSIRNFKVCQTHDLPERILNFIYWPYLKLYLTVLRRICSKVQVQDLSHKYD